MKTALMVEAEGTKTFLDGVEKAWDIKNAVRKLMAGDTLVIRPNGIIVLRKLVIVRSSFREPLVCR